MLTSANLGGLSRQANPACTGPCAVKADANTTVSYGLLLLEPHRHSGEAGLRGSQSNILRDYGRN